MIYTDTNKSSFLVSGSVKLKLESVKYTTAYSHSEDPCRGCFIKLKEVNAVFLPLAAGDWVRESQPLSLPIKMLNNTTVKRTAKNFIKLTSTET